MGRSRTPCVAQGSTKMNTFYCCYCQRNKPIAQLNSRKGSRCQCKSCAENIQRRIAASQPRTAS